MWKHTRRASGRINAGRKYVEHTAYIQNQAFSKWKLNKRIIFLGLSSEDLTSGQNETTEIFINEKSFSLTLSLWTMLQRILIRWIR